MGKRVNGKLVLVSVHAAAHGMETVRAFGVGDHQTYEMELAQHGRADGDPDMQDNPDRVLENRIDRTLTRELTLGGRAQRTRDTSADASPRDGKPQHTSVKGDQPMPHDPGGELPANISLFDRVLINAGRLCYDAKIGQYVEKSAVLPPTHTHMGIWQHIGSPARRERHERRRRRCGRVDAGRDHIPRSRRGFQLRRLHVTREGHDDA